MDYEILHSIKPFFCYIPVACTENITYYQIKVNHITSVVVQELKYTPSYRYSPCIVTKTFKWHKNDILKDRVNFDHNTYPRQFQEWVQPILVLGLVYWERKFFIDFCHFHWIDHVLYYWQTDRLDRQLTRVMICNCLYFKPTVGIYSFKGWRFYNWIALYYSMEIKSYLSDLAEMATKWKVMAITIM